MAVDKEGFMHPTPHLYGLVSQLLEVSLTAQATLCDHTADMRKWDGKIYLDPRGMSREIARKLTREGYCRTLVLLSLVGSSPE